MEIDQKKKASVGGHSDRSGQSGQSGRFGRVFADPRAGFTRLAYLMGLVILFWIGCSDPTDVPPNPYDAVDYGNDSTSSYVPDPTSIVGIYENVLQVYCDNPGCHDGTFEPDFRTIQSSWSTMVYHDLNKNTADSAYDYRVLPGNADASMLIYRITQGDASLQQMPATGQTVPPNEVENIRTWINNGALDMFGNPGYLPNSEPIIVGYIAFNDNFTIRYDEVNNRLDSMIQNPFKVPSNSTVNLVFLVEDDSTAPQNMQVNQLRLSMDMDNFSGAQTVQAFFLTLGGVSAWVAPVQTGSFSTGDTVFMRYYINDGDQSFNTEFPRDELPEVYKTFSAFYVEP